jgi:hypothetical protein
MSGAQDAGGWPVKSAPAAKLIPHWVYFVLAPNCLLQFVTEQEIQTAREYFSRKIHPARRDVHPPHEHYWQRWFERLPAGVHREPSRIRMLRALDALLRDISRDKVPERCA